MIYPREENGRMDRWLNTAGLPIYRCCKDTGWL